MADDITLNNTTNQNDVVTLATTGEQGPPGIPGLNGSSIVDARLDKDGNLIVKLPVYDSNTAQILSTGGVITKQQWLDVQNDIIQLANAISQIDSGGVVVTKVNLATKDTAGIVQIGDGINVTDRGIISIDGQDVVEDVTNDPESTENMLNEVFDDVFKD